MCGKIDARITVRVKFGGRDFRTNNESLLAEWHSDFSNNVVSVGIRDAARSEWSALHSVLSTDTLLRQFGHRKLHVPAVVSYVGIVGVEFGVFKTVVAHPGVLVVDRVDEDENDGDGNYCDSHKSSYEGKVVLF